MASAPTNAPINATGKALHKAEDPFPLLEVLMQFMQVLCPDSINQCPRTHEKQRFVMYD